MEMGRCYWLLPQLYWHWSGWWGGTGTVMNYLTTLPLSDLKPPAPTPSCTTHCTNLLYSPSPHLSSSFLKIPLHLLLLGQRYLLRLIVM